MRPTAEMTKLSIQRATLRDTLAVLRHRHRRRKKLLVKLRNTTTQLIAAECEWEDRRKQRKAA
jgi:hypothetical protein